jgi:hypothetical protein
MILVQSIKNSIQGREVIKNNTNHNTRRKKPKWKTNTGKLI